MKFNIYALPLMASLCATMPATGQTNEPITLSLQQAMDYATKNNVAAKNAQLDVLIQEVQNNEVTANAYPRINGQGQFIDYIDPMQSFIPGEFFNQPGTFVPVQFTPKYSSSLALSGSQIIFDGGVLVALQARKSVLELARQNGKLTTENLRYNVQKAYRALVIANKQFSILKQSLSNARSMAQDMFAMHDAGFTEKIDVDRTNVQVNNLAADSMRIGNLLRVSEQLLKFQMGMSIEQPVVLTDTAVSGQILQASAMLESTADFSHRTEFSLLQTQQKLNGYNLRRYQYAAIPTLSAFGNMGYNYSSNKFKSLFGEQYIWSSYVGLQLNFTLFNGLLRQNQVKEVKLNMLKTQNNIDNLKLTIDFQTKSARTTLRNALLQAESQRRNALLAASVLDLAQRKYKEGVGSNLEVTQAQTEYLQAQNNYFNVLMEISNAEADLKKALGDF
ncbi:MAG: TolC family protein [Bacteroidetes bacterium]|nr:TolC family protein [Bacteroidota bacterium]MBS1740093.1 TolC family protein [Bacteroidota bacterium]